MEFVIFNRSQFYIMLWILCMSHFWYISIIKFQLDKKQDYIMLIWSKQSANSPKYQILLKICLAD
jgi:hypothetical protein